MKFKLVDNLNESLTTHAKLNPKLFNNAGEMYPEVRDRLILIADKFIEDLKENNIPLKIYDYWIVGSNAAYNYNLGLSDIDLHIIVDVDGVNINPEILQILYNYAKSDFNNKHDIYVKDQLVEVYLEDINTSAVSNGIYSLGQDKWIKEATPLEEKDLRIEDTAEFDGWYKNYNSLIHDNPSKEDIQKFIDDLYLMRKESLASSGEFGVGNLIFKEFRNQGILQELKHKMVEIEDKELTLEHVRE